MRKMLLCSLLFSMHLVACTPRFLDRYTNSERSIVSSDLNGIVIDIKKNYNVSKYRSPNYRSMHSLVYSPLPFDATLPKNLGSFTSLGSTHYFFYPDHQVIIFDVIDEYEKVKRDSVNLNPSRSEVEDILGDQMYPFLDDKSKLNGYKYKQKRRNTIIYKDNAEIKLINIKPSNYDTYYALVNEFKFVEDTRK